MFLGRVNTVGLSDADIWTDKLSSACDEVYDFVPYPNPSASETTELLNCAVLIKDSFNAKFEVRPVKRVLYANTSKMVDRLDPSKS